MARRVTGEMAEHAPHTDHVDPLEALIAHDNTKGFVEVEPVDSMVALVVDGGTEGADVLVDPVEPMTALVVHGEHVEYNKGVGPKEACNYCIDIAGSLQVDFVESDWGLWILSEQTEGELAEVKGASNTDPIEPVEALMAHDDANGIVHVSENRLEDPPILVLSV